MVHYLSFPEHCRHLSSHFLNKFLKEVRLYLLHELLQQFWRWHVFSAKIKHFMMQKPKYQVNNFTDEFKFPKKFAKKRFHHIITARWSSLCSRPCWQSRGQRLCLTFGTTFVAISAPTKPFCVWVHPINIFLCKPRKWAHRRHVDSHLKFKV